MDQHYESFSFGIIVEDVEDWDQEDIVAADNDDSTDDYVDYAVSQLTECMRQAGEAYIEEHPNMFFGPLS